MMRHLIAVWLLALWAGAGAAPLVSALLPESACDCGCDHSEGPCCCRRAERARAAEPHWRSGRECDGRCCGHTASLAYRLTAFIPASRPAVSDSSVIRSLATARQPERPSRPLDFRLFERPPPATSHL